MDAIARRLIWQPGDLTVPNNVGRSTRLPSPRVKPSPLRNRSKSVSGVSYAKKSAEKRQSAPAVATGSSQGHKSTAPGTAQPIVEKVAEQKAQGYPARFRDPPLTPQVKSIFSYFVKEYKEGKDKRGRRYCTDNGKRVTCRGGPQKPAPKPSTAQPDKETGRRQTAEEKESGKRRKAEEKASEKQRKQQQKEGEKKQKEEARATAKQQKADAKVIAKKQKEEAKQAAKEQADKVAKEAVSKALDAAREISKDPSKATAQQVKTVGDALLTLKLDELKKLKTELGITKGSTKAAIVEGIKKQALDNAAKGKVPGQEQKPKEQKDTWHPLSSDTETRKRLDAFVASTKDLPDTVAMRKKVIASLEELNNLSKKDPASYRQKAAEHAKLVKDIADVEKEHGQKARELLRQHFAVDKQAEWNIEGVEGFGKKGRKSIKSAMSFLKDIVHFDAHGEDAEIYADFILLEDEDGRANNYADSINMTEEELPEVVAHEIAHTITGQEDANGQHRVQELCMDFVKHRLKGEEPVQMNKIPGLEDYGFGDDEKGAKDDFAKALTGSADIGSAYYCGKTYEANSEILSMGVEQLYRNPVHLARSDPEFFQFVMGILSGRLINRDGKSSQKKPEHKPEDDNLPDNDLIFDDF